MAKIVLLAFVITLVVDFIAGLFFILGSPGRKLSLYRSVICIVLLAGVNLVLWVAAIFKRFGTGIDSLKEFAGNLRTGSFLYQDIEYIVLVTLLGTVITFVFSFYLRRLIYDSQPEISRLQENLMIISVIMCAGLMCTGFE